MYNYFVATIGKRDVQINRSRLQENDLALVQDGKQWLIKHLSSGTTIEIDAPGNNMSDPNETHFTIKKPRIAGNIIKENPSFLAACDFPIITPVLNRILEDGKIIKEIKLVYTDQVTEGYRDGDTLYFSSIITKNIEQTYNIVVDEFAVWRSPADIDIQYSDFKHKQSMADANLLPPDEEVNDIYLLAQGGMDQVNFALTLRLIENYRGKLIYFQKPEKEAVRVRDFPLHFIKNLTRNQAIELINNLEFKGARKILISDTLQTICEFAVENIALNYPTAEQLSSNEKIKNLPFIKDYSDAVGKLTDTEFRQLVLSISIVHDFEKAEPNNLLWKLRTLGEIILLPEVEAFLGLENQDYDKSVFHERVVEKKVNGEKLINYLTKKNSKAKFILENRRTLLDDYEMLQDIYNFKHKDNLKAKRKNTESLRVALFDIREMRNELIHKGYYFTMDDLNNAFQSRNLNLKSLIKCIENYFVDLGINKEILHITDACKNYCLQQLEEDNW